jgi:tRNA (guanine26-N2/guanine27-N2)-dimethyltransferase
VFYNPDMVVDRDLGVAFSAGHFSGGSHRGWDMLAATGVRGLRLLVESGSFSSFLFTEANPAAGSVLERNAAHTPGASVRRVDARTPPPEGPFDYVDLDPYGSPLPFLTTAIRAVREGGVLAVTATDLMVLAGVQPGACERRYGGRPVRGRLGPEGGLRILLAVLVRTARADGRTVRPLLAYVRGHHVRAYVEVGRAAADHPPEPVGRIEPAHWTGPVVGDHGPYGPMWLGPLFDGALAARLTVPASAGRPRELEEFLSTVRSEADVDRSFYYEANELAGALHLRSPPSRGAFAERLAQRGFRMSRTHMRPEAFRTDAPRVVVEAIARELGHALVPSRLPAPPVTETDDRD